MDPTSPSCRHSTPPAAAAAATTTTSPLQAASADRVNQQREPSSFMSSFQRSGTIVPAAGHSRDSSVHDKISQFNTLAVQSKQLERKTTDAALKRAMLGREEAEVEMRRYRDEARALRRQVEEGKERERKVGERLETVMENYGRAKETHAHTQALWEKEIRRARKDTFKSQSVIVKLQEELKAARAAAQAAETALTEEKERAQAKEQEAFAARYEVVGVQEQLEQMQERLKAVEQERDAFKTLAKSEEDLARIAAEGRLPLPKPEAKEDVEREVDNDKLASPAKESPKPRQASLSTTDVKFSESSEAEIEELSLRLQWEKQRADRAEDHVEYLQAECLMRACPCMRSRPRTSILSQSHRRQPSMEIVDPSDHAIIGGKRSMSPQRSTFSPKRSRVDNPKCRSSRRSTIFVPEEGVFRTVSQEEAEAMAAPSIPIVEEEESADTTVELATPITPLTPVETKNNPDAFARTPSLDPPAFAVLSDSRTSLLSLLDAPHQKDEPSARFEIPTMSGMVIQQEFVQEATVVEEVRVPAPSQARRYETPDTALPVPEPERAAREKTPTDGDFEATIVAERGRTRSPEAGALPTTSIPDREYESQVRARERRQPTEASMVEEDRRQSPEPAPRPHTSAARYGAVQTATMTTKVPLREENTDPSLAKRLMALQRTPSHSSSVRSSTSSRGWSAADDDGPSFDVTNPALTPTMTREQALAQIRERRGRARSAMGTNRPVTPGAGARPVTPGGGARPITPGGGAGTGGPAKRPIKQPALGERRDVSAPVGRTAAPLSAARRRVRS
ncbi:hypothetical protein RB595_004362 [Gaeumannomyces hyphopodioides]